MPEATAIACRCGWFVPVGVGAVTREVLEELIVKRRDTVDETEFVDVPVILRCPVCDLPHCFDPNVSEVLKQQALVAQLRESERTGGKSAS